MAKSRKSEMDILVDKMFEDLQKAKDNLKSGEEKATFKTNLIFISLHDDKRNNLNVINKVETLLEYMKEIVTSHTAHNESCRLLDIDIPFTYLGYSFEDWVHDFKIKINKLNLDKVRETVRTLEQGLSRVLSPEQIRAKEIERLQEEMKKINN